jgi:uncharacterized protein YuzE
MKISYDSQVDAVYIRLFKAPMQVTTQRLSEDVAVNYAPDGRIVGIEILDASQYVFAPDTERQVVVQNLVAVPAQISLYLQ